MAEKQKAVGFIECATCGDNNAEVAPFKKGNGYFTRCACGTDQRRGAARQEWIIENMRENRIEALPEPEPEAVEEPQPEAVETPEEKPEASGGFFGLVAGATAIAAYLVFRRG